MNNQKDKKERLPVQIELIYFDKEDVISTSGFEGEIDDWDETNPEENS